MRISDWSSDVCSSDLFLAQLLDQLHAGHLGQAEVDDADVERHLAPHVQAFLAVLGGVHRETFALQARGERLAQRGFVFDEENSHRLLQRSEEHTSELQSLMRISYAVFCLKKKTIA